jgi:hypothetical protein
MMDGAGETILFSTTVPRSWKMRLQLYEVFADNPFQTDELIVGMYSSAILFAWTREEFCWSSCRDGFGNRLGG